MKQPLVSIVVPSFNQGQFLDQCLCSILNQDYKNIEIIVIDGGSTDVSVEIIRRYQDRLAYWVSEPDNGQSHAINKGFRRAKGEIVAWLNSDDVYLPGAVSLAVQRFQAHPNLALFYGHCVYIDEQGSFLRYFTEVEPWNKLRLLNYSDFIMQPTTFFLREKLRQVDLLDETLHYCMDWDLWCKLAAAGDVHYEPRVIASNREYGTTKTSSGSWVRLRELLKVQRRHMTGFWPHAFFGFCATEFNLKAGLTSSVLVSALLRGAAYAVLALAPAALAQNRKLSANRNLYGFSPHSSEVPDGQAAIYLPLTPGASSLVFTVCAASGISISVETPDSSQCVTGDGDVMTVILPIGEKTSTTGYTYASVQFKNQKGESAKGEISSVSFQ